MSNEWGPAGSHYSLLITYYLELDAERDAVDADAGAIEADGDLALAGVEKDAVGTGAERGDADLVNHLSLQRRERFGDGGGGGGRLGAARRSLVDPAEPNLAVGAVHSAHPTALQSDLENPGELVEVLLRYATGLNRIGQRF